MYCRQEGQSILLGTYEQNNRPWSPKETPWEFVFQLLAHDLDRIAPELERGFAHFPAVGRAGIQKLRQRAVHVQSRWQSARRADPGACAGCGSRAR